MLQTYKSKREDGFTIIEVLIVLAIAGLILLIVFLAVPALQRNSRNTGRKNDLARIGGAVTEYITNSNGKIPAAAADAITDPADKILAAAGTLGQYDFTGATNQAKFTIVTRATAAATTITDKDAVRIVTGAKCHATSVGQVADGSSRQIAIQYASETTSATGIAACIEY